VRTLDVLDRLRLENTGSFLAYLRQVVLNAARQAIRRSGRRPVHDADESLEAIEAGPPLRGEGPTLARDGHRLRARPPGPARPAAPGGGPAARVRSHLSGDRPRARVVLRQRGADAGLPQPDASGTGSRGGRGPLGDERMNVDEEGLLDLAGEIADGAWVDWSSLGGGSETGVVRTPLEPVLRRRDSGRRSSPRRVGKLRPGVQRSVDRVRVHPGLWPRHHFEIAVRPVVLRRPTR